MTATNPENKNNLQALFVMGLLFWNVFKTTMLPCKYCVFDEMVKNTA
jgi:hypothetical protein